jgi:hypothetical protein
VVAISITAYERFLDQLAERIKRECDATSRTSLLAKFELICAEGRKLHFAEELQIRGIRLVKDH